MVNHKYVDKFNKVVLHVSGIPEGRRALPYLKNLTGRGEDKQEMHMGPWKSVEFYE